MTSASACGGQRWTARCATMAFRYPGAVDTCGAGDFDSLTEAMRETAARTAYHFDAVLARDTAGNAA